jgi:hypothetical protein
LMCSSFVYLFVCPADEHANMKHEMQNWDTNTKHGGERETPETGNWAP